MQHRTRSNAIHPVIFLDSYPKPCYRDSWFPGSPRWAFAPTLRRPASLFANQLPLNAPTGIPIPFLFNHSWSLRLRRRPTARLSSLLFSLPYGPSLLQQGGTPPPLPRARHGGRTASLSLSRPRLDSISSISPLPSHFSSTAYKMLPPQLLCFHNHPF
jgi:hypothetical protein